MTNTQVNLEQTVQKSMLKRIGEGLKNKLGGAKRYATIVVATAGLALGGTYIGGCDTETTECCAQLDCDQYSKSGDRYNCGTTTNTIYKDELCVTLDDGTRDCCRCFYEGSYGGPNVDNY